MTNSVERAEAFIDPARLLSFEEIPPENLAKARSETLNLMQWLVRVANSFVADTTADDRIVLRFSAADASFVTKPFENDLALTLRLPTLELQFTEQGERVPHVLDPEEHSPAEVEAWLLVELLHRGVDRTKFSKQLPYKMAGLLSGDAEDYSPRSCMQGLEYLAAWFRFAAPLLAGAAAGSPAGVICRPQRLDLACSSGEGSERWERGFSAGDGQHAEPFFYRELRGSSGPSGGKERSTLRVSQLLRETNPAAAVSAFLKSASV